MRDETVSIMDELTFPDGLFQDGRTEPDWGS